MRDTRESRLLLILLVAVAFALITVDIKGGESSPLGGARRAAATVLGPVERGAASAVDPVADTVRAFRDAASNSGRTDQLARENTELRQKLASSDMAGGRTKQLDDLLRTAGAGGYTVKAAQTIAIGPAQGFSWTITIDAGSDDGLTRDMTVVNGQGLVGRITTVAPTTSTVLLASDPGFTAGTRLEGTGEIGFAAGGGTSAMKVSSSTARPRSRRATGWSPSARRAAARSSPASRSAGSSRSRPPRDSSPRPSWSNPSSSSPGWTWSASSSSRPAPTRATPSCRPPPRRAPRARPPPRPPPRRPRPSRPPSPLGGTEPCASPASPSPRS